MNRRTPVTIIAPHCDDELIGCFRLLKARRVGRVVYCRELEPRRVKEAESCAATYGFTPVFGLSNFENEDSETLINAAPDEIIYVPHGSDSHPAHKELNNWAFNLTNHLRYYSVDMSSALNYDVLSEEEQKEKRESLLEHYPSQRALILSDARYHLFEYDGSSTSLRSYVYTLKDVKEHKLGRVDLKIELPEKPVYEKMDSVLKELRAGFDEDDLLKIIARRFPRRSIHITLTKDLLEIKYDYFYR